jgi:hypothetical protein
VIPAAGYGQREYPQAGERPTYVQGASQNPNDPPRTPQPGPSTDPYQSGPPADPYQSGRLGGYDDPLGGRHTGMPGQQYPYGGDRGGQR